MSTKRCFKCQGLGHIATDFSNCNVITLAEWKVIEEEEEIEEQNEGEIEGDHEETLEEVEEETNEGEMLVLRRVLNGQKGAKDEQRDNVFHTWCTIQDNVCSLIIDGRSCANVVSLSMIEKLGLQAMVHPHPYNIQWLNQSKGLQVNSPVHHFFIHW